MKKNMKLSETKSRLIWLISSLSLISFIDCDEEAGGVAYEYKPDEYPSLMKNPKLCSGSFRNPPTSICDPDNIIKPEDAKKLDQLINQQQNRASCFCNPCNEQNPNGLLIKIALVRSINLSANRSIDQSVEQFADRTREKWNFGDKCQHDVLIFVATTYNIIKISMGKKAESIIGTKAVLNIVDDTKKSLSKNHISESLKFILTKLHTLELDYHPTLDRLKLGNGNFLILIAVSLLLIISIIFVYVYLRNEKKLKKKDNSSLNNPESLHQSKQLLENPNKILY